MRKTTERLLELEAEVFDDRVGQELDAHLLQLVLGLGVVAFVELELDELADALRGLDEQLTEKGADLTLAGVSAVAHEALDAAGCHSTWMPCRAVPGASLRRCMALQSATDRDSGALLEARESPARVPRGSSGEHAGTTRPAFDASLLRMETAVHIFAGHFADVADAAAYSEERWEPEPGDASEEAYAAWEDRNPHWAMRDDLGIDRYLDHDYIETLHTDDLGGASGLWCYLAGLLKDDDTLARVRASVGSRNTVILVFVQALDGRDVSFESTGVVRYCGRHRAFLGE